MMIPTGQEKRTVWSLELGRFVRWCFCQFAVGIVWDSIAIGHGESTDSHSRDLERAREIGEAMCLDSRGIYMA